MPLTWQENCIAKSGEMSVSKVIYGLVLILFWKEKSRLSKHAFKTKLSQKLSPVYILA